MARARIPRVLHQIWIGDESRRPDDLIDSWRSMPGWEHRLWGDDDLDAGGWRLGALIETLRREQPAGAADLMRYEILADRGGVYADADARRVAPIPDWMLDCDSFCVSENERTQPGLLANGFLGARRGCALFRRLVDEAEARGEAMLRGGDGALLPAWKSVGPVFLTSMHRALDYADLTVLPSHFFLPRHFNRRIRGYSGGGPVLAEHYWGGTRGLYGVARMRPVRRRLIRRRRRLPGP